MELILKDYSWNMDGYVPYTSQGKSGQLTLKDAYMAYHLLPSPPLLQPGGSPDDRIRMAQETHELKYKQKSVQRKGKKITAAVYAYQVDNGGEWGEIQFDLVEKSAWVEVFAENDPCDTWEITDCAIDAVLGCDEGKLLKKAFIPIPW